MKGFTLVEVLVVAAITVLLTGFMVANFSRSRVDLNQTALMVQDAIREAQSMALSGALYAKPGVSGSYRCGYGIHFMANGFTLYAGPDSGTADCSSLNRNYDAGTDDVVRTGLLSNATVEIVLPAPDIFFQPPNPDTYINNDDSPGNYADIHVRRQGADCSGTSTPDCRTIHVTTAGIITTK